MSYYDDYVDNPVQAEDYATSSSSNSTRPPPEFTPGPLPGGDVRGLSGGIIPILLLVLLVVGLIAFPFLIKKFK
jgi:hypothetical protein